MRTLQNHTIIYDDECPMCGVYTGAFVRTGMLDRNGRLAYSEVVDKEIPGIDWQKARNQIALIDKETNTIKYGVESLTTILGHSLPVLRPLFGIRLFQWLIGQLYLFISYNRKVIAPGAVFEGRNKCTPDLNYAYRWAYIVVAWLVTSLILVQYTMLMAPIVSASGFWREFIVCGGQLLFQGAVLAVVKKERLIHYLGNMMTVSLGGALLLTPALAVAKWIDSPLLFAAYFLFVAALMLAEHIRRVKILELPWTLSATWVLYRLLVLIIILTIPL